VPIIKIPIDILLRILQLVGPPRTRDGLYALNKLSHVCMLWRLVLISHPRVWATVFITGKDRRSFVEMCLERSQPVTLEVTVDASEEGRARPRGPSEERCAQPRCTCDMDGRGRLLPNEGNPCEWHFQFESLAQKGYSKRIYTLNVGFDGEYIPPEERQQLALGSCRFFTLPFPNLAGLGWEDDTTEHANHIFSTPPFPPTLRSLSFQGSWGGSATRVSNLVSFTFGSSGTVSIESIRLFISNNRTLESLSFTPYADLEGTSKGPPISLFNLKSFRVDYSPKVVSTIVRIPALQRLSSLRISMEDEDEDEERFTLHATGDGITLSTKSKLPEIAEVWHDLTGYARPAIYHVRLHSDPAVDPSASGTSSTAASLLLDAHTLEIGDEYFPFWYNGFLGDLKQLGPQLRTIRFAISDTQEPFQSRGDEYEDWGGYLLDGIEELVKHRCEEGRPFSVVERMVVSGGERSNRQQDYAWRCFYGSRDLGQYVRSG